MASRKLKLGAELSSTGIKDKLIEEFKLNPKTNIHLLLDAQNNIQDFETLRQYYHQQQQRYTGATRLYIGLQPIWDGLYADIDINDIKQLLVREVQESHDDGECNEVEVEEGYVLYYQCAKVLKFAHDTGKLYARHTSWHDYYVVPLTDLSLLDEYEDDPNWFISNEPLVYFLRHNIQALNATVEDMGGGVWKLTQAVSEMFQDWVDRMKSE